MDLNVIIMAKWIIITNLKALEDVVSMVVQCLNVSIEEEKEKGGEDIYIVIIMLANLRIISIMGRGSILGLMARYRMDNGRIKFILVEYIL